MRTLVVCAVVAVLLAVSGAGADPVARHFELKRSLPAADSALATMPDRVQLWFTQAPQLEGARIRLVDASGGLLPLGDVAAADGDPTSLLAAVPEAVAPGRYTVHWRAMAQDGHMVSGEIPFTLGAPGPTR